MTAAVTADIIVLKIHQTSHNSFLLTMMSLGHFQLYPEETFIAHLCFMESIKLVSGASPKLPEEKQDNH